MTAKGAEYYDDVYRQADSFSTSLTVTVAGRVRGRSILDLGCGMGFLASLIECEYLGVDFSGVALEKARRLHGRIGAEFLLADIRELPLSASFDTVVLQEVLEHLDDPVLVVKKACSLARRRVIATVPRNIPDPAHVKSHWAEEDVRQLLGNGARIERCGWYWIAVEDM